MNIFIYSDESGVFDNQHENYFVFGGLIFFSKEDKDNATRKFKAHSTDFVTMIYGELDIKKKKILL